MNNCIFLYGGNNGICPYHNKSCDKSCDKYAIVGDDSKEIFHDWNNGIEKLVIELRIKHFGVTEKMVGVKPIKKDKAPVLTDQEIDIDEFLGE